VESETGFAGPPRRAVGWRDVLSPIGVGVGLLVLSILLTVGAIFVATLSDASRAGVHAALVGMETSFWFNNLLGIFFYAGLLLFMLWRVRRLDATTLIADFTPPPLSQLVAALLVGLGFAALTILLISQLEAHHLIHLQETARDRLLRARGPAQLAALLLLASVLAPLTEELYFRNILLSVLQRALGTVPAILVSAGLFALLHLQFLNHPGAAGWIATGVIFGLGIINALWVTRTGFLRLAIASHAAYNALLVVLPFALRH
jgi:membrane protease YdiL (CAAX protease family)